MPSSDAAAGCSSARSAAAAMAVRRPAAAVAVDGGGEYLVTGAPAALEQGVIDRGPRVEVLVEGRLAQADAPGDLGQVERGDTLLGHHRQRRVEDFLACLEPVSLARRHRTVRLARSHNQSIEQPISY